MASVSEERKKMESWPQDEPIFVLRGQDRIAWAIVYKWALEAERHGVSFEKINEAQQQAHRMEEYAKIHGKTPD